MSDADADPDREPRHERAEPDQHPARSSPNGDAVLACVLFVALLVPPALRLPETGWTGRRDEPVAAPIRPLVIDPNLCATERLQLLPRVGPVLAARIDAERRRFPFGDADDLLRVHGIGPATLSGLRRYVRFGPTRGSVGGELDGDGDRDQR